MGKNSKGKAAKQPAPGERQVIANNKKARHDYTILDTYEAGMVLTGTEVKSLREGKASLVDGFAVFYRDELWLEQVYIPEYLNGSWTNHAARRRRQRLGPQPGLQRGLVHQRDRGVERGCGHRAVVGRGIQGVGGHGGSLLQSGGPQEGRRRADLTQAQWQTPPAAGG